MTSVPFETWCVIIGAVLLSMTLLTTVIERLPLTTSVIYLVLGVALGPSIGKTFLHLDPVDSASFIHRFSEIVVIISLFTAGLKMRVALTWKRWRLPILLATVAMTLTVLCIALVGFYWLHLPLGAAILLGGILAPTDPVLASDIQVKHPRDRDTLRFSLTGEAGFNDGAAFPFVMLGLGLLGINKSFSWLHWLQIDVLWAIFGGLAIGAALGAGIGRFVLYLRRCHKEAVGLDDFLALSLIALSYGLALQCKTYGFLAVFAAGIALRQVERAHSLRSVQTTDAPTETPPQMDSLDLAASPEAGEKDDSPATDPKIAPEYMAHAMLNFNEQLDRIGEIVAVIFIGVMLAGIGLSMEALWLAPLIFLVIRPLCVWLGTLGVRDIKNAPYERRLRRYLAWFGVRGIGSLYYFSYAIDHGLSRDLSTRLSHITISIIAISIVVHGISVTPFMNRYEEKKTT